MASKAIQELSIETKMIYDRLQKAAVGEVIPYRELSALIGSDVQGQSYSHLASARRKILAEHRVVFGAVRGEGVKRLDDTGIVDVGESEIRGIRRKARRGAHKIGAADPGKLGADDRLRHATAATILAFVHRATGKASQKAIGGAVKTSAAELPMGRTLEVLGRKAGKTEVGAAKD